MITRTPPAPSTEVPVRFRVLQKLASTAAMRREAAIKPAKGQCFPSTSSA